MAQGAPLPALLRRGFAVEYVTLAWNVVGLVVLAVAAAAARPVALAGFGLDSLIEIGASTVVIWELSGQGRIASTAACGRSSPGTAENLGRARIPCPDVRRLSAGQPGRGS